MKYNIKYNERRVIMWDDDLDIAMPREDYQKFLIIAENELNSPLQLVLSNNSKNYYQPYAKVVNKNTLFMESEYYKLGIFVDIFPYDINKGISMSLKFRRNLFRVFCDVPDNHNMLPWALKYIPSHIFALFMNSRKALKIANMIAQTGSTNGQYYSNFASGYRIERETYPISWFENCILTRFEDRGFYIPENSDGVLKTVFGKNYMEVPPENLRKTHCPIKVVFSDGEEMTFAKQDHTVTHEDVEAFADYE